MEPRVQSARTMLALKNACAALGLGIVACSASSPTVPAPEENSIEVPPVAEPKEPLPQRADEAPDQHVVAPPNIKTQQEPPACGKEKEPNNDIDTATEIDKCISGELAGWQDVDYLKIRAPEGVTDMVIDHAEPKGKITYTVTIPSGSGDGGGMNNFNMSFSDKAPKTKITPGQTYLFQLKWDNTSQGKTSDARPWELRVAFE